MRLMEMAPIVDISPTLPMSIPSSLEIQTTIGLSAVVNQQLLESVNIVPIPQDAMIGIPTQIDMKQLKKSIREAGKVDHKPQQQPSETRVFIDEYSIFHGHKMFQIVFIGFINFVIHLIITNHINSRFPID